MATPLATVYPGAPACGAMYATATIVEHKRVEYTFVPRKFCFDKNIR